MKKKQKKVEDRCTGHCCECFTLPVGPDEVWASYYRWVTDEKNAHQWDLEKSDALPSKARGPFYTDIHLIAPMVKYLGHAPLPFKQINVNDEILLGEEPKKYHLYTCKHFDKKARNCTIYEFRPQMCRDYPYGSGCNYAACTWKHHKQLKVDVRKRKKHLKEVRAGLGGDKIKASVGCDSEPKLK